MVVQLESGDSSIVPATANAETTFCFDWKGRCAARSPSEILAPFFDDVLAEAAANGAAVEMRFNQLTHFNSSTVSALLAFIEDARQRRVRLTIVYDGSAKWQRLSFGAMRVLSRDDGLFELRAV